MEQKWRRRLDSRGRRGVAEEPPGVAGSRRGVAEGPPSDDIVEATGGYGRLREATGGNGRLLPRATDLEVDTPLTCPWTKYSSMTRIQFWFA